MKNSSRWQASVCASLCMFSGTYAQAAIIQLNGDDVIFKYDDSTPGNINALTLFGTPTAIGNGLTFTPNNFRADALGANDADSANATFVFDVWANDGFVLDTTSLFESGDYYLQNADSGVTGSGFLQIVDLDTSASVNETLVFSDLTTVGTQTNWSGQADIDIMNSFDNAVHHGRISMQNNMLAFTGATGINAWIEKKFVDQDFGVVVGVSEIPIPAAVWLFGSGLLGLVGIARRKKAS